MKVTIRRATSSDAESFAEILCRTWSEAYRGLIPDDIIKSYANPERRKKQLPELLSYGRDIRLLVFEGKPCALITANYGDKAEIQQLYVLPEYQGRGFGSKLIRSVLSTAKKHGCVRAVLDVLRENASALAFYKKMGFNVCGVTDSELFGNTQITLMEKPL